MRSRTSILLPVLIGMACALEAVPLRFSSARWFPDIGLSMPLPEGFSADPVEMPKAEAFLVTDVRGVRHLEDRFDTFELWTSLTVRGRWTDAAGHSFSIARLVAEVPTDAPEEMRTRGDFRARLKPLGPKNVTRRNEAVNALSPVEVFPPVRPRRAGRRNFLEIFRYPSTNDHVLVYAFRPRSPERHETPDWYVVTLCAPAAADADDLEARFSDGFLEHVSVPALRARTGKGQEPLPLKADGDETAWLREDYRRSVVNYAEWHFTSSGDLMIADDLDDLSRGTFLGNLTNDLPRLRAEYARRFPSPLAETFHPAAIRVFRTREEYLAYLGLQAKWTAAVWSPLRRELVLYLPQTGVTALLRTLAHEAFHQYLSYAASMLSVSPFLNEGHAELFEHASLDDEGNLAFEKPYEYARFIELNADRLAAFLPAFFEMDYDAFYAGDADAREAKYRLAWSVAYFLEVGAPELRFRPFEDVREGYLKNLVEKRAALPALRATFPADRQKRFVAEYLAFWKRR